MIDDIPSPKDIQEIVEETNDKHLVIIQNKEDKENSVKIPLYTFHSLHNYTFLRVSAKYNQHIDELEKTIYEAADIPTLTETDVIITNARHYDALVRARQSLSHVLDGMRSGLSGDLLSEDLRDVLSNLAEITGGQITPNEVLGNIFKHFCVGK